MSDKKEYRHKYSNIPISKELSEEEKDFILAMYNWTEGQLPMLTEKILVLNKNIKKLAKATSRYSIILIVLTFFLVVFTVITLIK